MNWVLLMSAFVMGLLGGPHCLAMCGVLCHKACSSQGLPTRRAMLPPMVGLHLGRMVGYGLLGGVVASSSQSLAWLSQQTPVLKPLWVGVHAASLVVGLWFVWFARQPLWVDAWAQRIWRVTRPLGQRLGQRSTWVAGLFWALMPCGLLYSALLLAALSNHAWGGMATMVAFGLGTSLSLGLGSWLWQQHGHRAWAQTGAMRMVGLGIAAGSAWALWHDATHPLLAAGCIN